MSYAYAHMGGEEFSHETMTPTDAKNRWPHFAAEIDAAVGKLASGLKSN